MSAVPVASSVTAAKPPSSLSTPERAPGDDQRALTLSPTARIYFALVATGAGVWAAFSLASLRISAADALAFTVFTAGASVAQLFTVEKGNNQRYRTAIVFLLAGVVVLQPASLVAMTIVHYIPASIRKREKWLVQSFNVCNTIIGALVAATVFTAVHGRDVHALGADHYVLPAIAAAAAFVVVNHVLVSGIIMLTSGKSLLGTGLFRFESLSTDLALAFLGIGAAALWSVDRWLIVFGLTPLLLIHRALYVPQLAERARVDPKTGLLNAKEFEHVLAAELERAARSRKPVSLLMADLDFLRDINNTHGHMAGDAVICGIADVFREHLRRYDVAARFGGEEFSLLLPETTAAEAVQIAERIREAVARHAFTVDTAATPLRASMSIGVSASHDGSIGPREFVHEADLAVYEAKAAGRNRVALAEPQAA